MKPLTIVVSECCLGSEKIRRDVEAIDWEALGIALSWVRFDPAAPLVRAHGIYATPTAIFDDQVLVVGVPDLDTLWPRIAPFL